MSNNWNSEVERYRYHYSGGIPYRIPQGYGNQIPDFGGSYFKVKSHENSGSVRAVLSTRDTVLVHL